LNIKQFGHKWSSEILRTKFWAAHQNLTRRIHVTHNDYSKEVRDAFAAFVKRSQDSGYISKTVAGKATLTPVIKNWKRKQRAEALAAKQ